MYKVFFNDRTVFINRSFNKSLIKNGLFFDFDSGDCLENEIQFFLSQEITQDMYIQGRNVFEVKEAFFRFFKVVEAAGGVVCSQENELLCIYRLGRWDLPKGKIEKGESKQIAAIREVEEETGLTGITIGEELPTTYHIYAHPKKEKVWVLKPTYWFLMKCKNDLGLKPQIEEGITKVKWIPQKEISRIAENTYASLVDLFKIYM